MQRRKLALLTALTLGVAAGGCNTKPKSLGNQKIDLGSLDPTGGATQAGFRFNFALRDSTTTSHLTSIFVQGAGSAQGTLESLCNTSGTGCACEFLNSSGATVPSTSSLITYDTTANYYICTFGDNVSDSNLATIASVRIHTIDERVSTTLSLTAPGALTLDQFIGSDLDVNHVRSVSRYTCQFQFMMKAGTSLTTFDCSNQATVCDAGTANFCLLKANFPYFTYADSYSNNQSSVIPDAFYFNGGTQCGMQLKKFDCITNQDNAKIFGLYGSSTTYWSVPISLPANPSATTSDLVGYAAAPNGAGICPPGLTKRVVWTLSEVASDLTPSHNFPDGLLSTEVASPTAAPAGFVIDTYGGGTCNGTTCTIPISYYQSKAPQAYTAGATSFCVLPNTMLP